jgi:hypothetical protein
MRRRWTGLPLREISGFGTWSGGRCGGLLFKGGDAVAKRAGLRLGRGRRIRHVDVMVNGRCVDSWACWSMTTSRLSWSATAGDGMFRSRLWLAQSATRLRHWQLELTVPCANYRFKDGSFGTGILVVIVSRGILEGPAVAPELTSVIGRLRCKVYSCGYSIVNNYSEP